MSLINNIDVSNWNTCNATAIDFMFVNCVGLEELDVSNWNVAKVENMKGLFSSLSEIGYMKISFLDVSKWNVEKVTTMEGMFQNCVKLEELDVSNWNVANVTNMKNMFLNSNSLESLDVSNWNVGNVTTMLSMFRGCNSLQSLDVSNWNVGSVTTMRTMFYGCNSLESLNVSRWDVSKVTTMHGMFAMETGNSEDRYERASALTNLDVSNWDTSSLTDVSFMFWGADKLGSIDVSNWDVSKVTTFDHMTAHSYLTLEGVDNWVVTDACTNMNGMFHSVNNTSLDVSKYDTSNVQFFDQMFENSQYLTEIIGLENFDTSNGLGFQDMFNACYSLKELDLSSFDTSKATDGIVNSGNEGVTNTMALMFQNCRSLEKITLGENFTFKGDGTTTDTSNYAVLPTPSSTYITGADGKWYNSETGDAYTPEELIESHTGTVTYVAVEPVVEATPEAITSIHLSYNDVAVGETADPALVIFPTTYGYYQYIEYEVSDGENVVSIEDPSTGIVTGLAEGTATIKVTIIDAYGNESEATYTITSFIPLS